MDIHATFCTFLCVLINLCLSVDTFRIQSFGLGSHGDFSDNTGDSVLKSLKDPSGNTLESHTVIKSGIKNPINVDRLSRTNKFNAVDKRFLQFSPFIANSKDKDASYPVPQKTFENGFVARGKPRKTFVPFIDHFSGVRSFGLHFFKPSEAQSSVNKSPIDLINAVSTKKEIRPDFDSMGGIQIDDSQNTVLPGITTRMFSTESEHTDSSSNAEKLSRPSKYHETRLPQYVNLGVQSEGTDIPEAKSSFQSNYLTEKETGNNSGFKSGSAKKDELYPFNDNDNNSKKNEKLSKQLQYEDQSFSGFYDDNSFGAFSDLIEDKNSQNVNFNDKTDIIGFAPFKDTEPFSSQSSLGFYDPFYADPKDGFASMGSFNSDTSDCADIEIRRCSGDDECSCYGFYSCQHGFCHLTDTIADVEPKSEGTWHDDPVFFPDID